MKEKAERLLVTAGILLICSGLIFAILQERLCAVLTWVGAFGCLAAALGFNHRKDGK